MPRSAGRVGGTTALMPASPPTWPGTTDLNGGNVTTTGNQTYNDKVTLGNNTLLTDTGSGRNVDLRPSTVNWPVQR